MGSILIMRGFWRSKDDSARIGSIDGVKMASISAFSVSALFREALATLVMQTNIMTEHKQGKEKKAFSIS